MSLLETFLVVAAAVVVVVVVMIRVLLMPAKSIWLTNMESQLSLRLELTGAEETYIH